MGSLYVTDLDPLLGCWEGSCRREGLSKLCCPHPSLPLENLPLCDPDQPRWVRARSGSGPSCQGARGRGRR